MFFCAYLSAFLSKLLGRAAKLLFAAANKVRGESESPLLHIRSGNKERRPLSHSEAATIQGAMGLKTPLPSYIRSGNKERRPSLTHSEQQQFRERGAQGAPSGVGGVRRRGTKQTSPYPTAHFRPTQTTYLPVVATKK